MESSSTPTILPTVLNGSILAWHSGGHTDREWNNDYNVWLRPNEYIVEDRAGVRWMVRATLLR
jgi:hypothetical protein